MLHGLCTSLLLGAAAVAADPVAAPPAPSSLPTYVVPSAPAAAPAAAQPGAPAPVVSSAPVGIADQPCSDILGGCAKTRGLFESDKMFEGFIGPITNPFLAKDPRSQTELRLLFVENNIPNDNFLGGGDFQVYGAQVRLAVTERLTLFADKDGYASIHPGVGRSRDGFLNLAFGGKYTLIRDVEKQLLGTVGIQYEMNTGESDVLQHNGNGLMTLFAAGGKEFWDYYHVVLNGGWQFPMNSNRNSSFFYAQAHFDRQCFGWLYPLVEFNWYGYNDGGNHGIPNSLGEGDGLLNFGTTGVSGDNLFTGAVGLKAVVGPHMQIGAAWEIPLGSTKYLMDNRLTAEVIFRY